MWSARRSPLGLPLLLALAGAPACSTDADALAARPRPGAVPRDRPADAAPPPAEDASSSGEPGQSDARVPERPAEPPGPVRLTLLHGVADAERIAFCFARIGSGGDAHFPGDPVPPGGLAFGGAAVFERLDGLDLAGDSIQPFVLAGDLTLIDGLGCADLAEGHSFAPDAGSDAAPPIAADSGSFDAAVPDAAVPDAAAPADSGSFDAAVPDATAPADASPVPDAAPEAAVPPRSPLRAAALPVIPAGSLAAERSYLLVPAGCIGGPGFTHRHERLVCGDAYAPDRPTLAPLLVTVSRITEPFAIGLQLLHASPAFGTLDARIVPPDDSDARPIPLADRLVAGEIAPYPPRTDRRAAAYGIDAGWSLELLGRSSGTPLHRAPWSSIFAASALSTLEDGKSYALVLVGSGPGLAPGPWWNAPLVTAVEG